MVIGSVSSQNIVSGYKFQYNITFPEFTIITFGGTTQNQLSDTVVIYELIKYTCTSVLLLRVE